MGNGQVRRYIGGKRPQKYFSEDLWAECSDLLLKLNIDEGKGFEIFNIFSKIDKDESGTVEVEECLKFFGGHRTKFSSRIFEVLDLNAKEGMPFIDFTTTMWNFCTLSTILMARFVFEIFDVDNTGVLEVPDIEAMYRMLYDVDKHDQKVVDSIKFDADGKVTKDNFMARVRSKKALIKPALEYQSRLRSALGGLIMWESLTGYRKRYFSVFDTQSTTLEESFKAILMSEDPNKKEVALEADEILHLEREKLQAAADIAKQRLEEFEKHKQLEKRKINMQQDDRAMNLAWMAVEAKRIEFEKMVFTTENIWDRQEQRMELYKVFDRAVDTARRVWEEKYRKEEIAVEGVEADRKARLRDFLQTEVRNTLNYNYNEQKGKAEKERLQLIHVLRGVEQRLKEQNAEKEREHITKTIASVQREISLLENGNLNFIQPLRLTQKYTKKKHFDETEEKAMEDCQQLVMKLAFDDLHEKQRLDQEERMKNIKRREFELFTKYGSRITRWELVDDVEHNRKVYVNIDTLKVMPFKTAICELCDAIIEVNDLKCFNCHAPRSAKNSVYYKPLGAL